MFPVTIQYFDWKNGGLQSKLIEVRNTPNETDDMIVQYVKETVFKSVLFFGVSLSRLSSFLECPSLDCPIFLKVKIW